MIKTTLNKINTYLASPLFVTFWFFMLNILYFVFIFKPSISSIFVFNMFPFSVFRSILVLLLIILYYVIYINTFNKKSNILSNLWKYRSVIIFQSFVIVVGLLMSILESYNYTNFVYSRYHIYIEYLQDLSNLYILTFVSFVFIYFERNNKKLIFNSKKGNTIVNIPKESFLLFLVLLTLMKGLIDSYKVVVADVKNIFKVVNTNIPIKYYAYDLNDFSIKMYFIKENTPENAVIFHPPQSWDYPDIGNQVLVRYFLFPRTLISPKKISDYYNDRVGSECNEFTIISVNYQNKEQYYPYVNIEYEEMVLLQNNKEISRYYEGVYNSEEMNKIKPVVGIIKHKRCGI